MWTPDAVKKTNQDDKDGWRERERERDITLYYQHDLIMMNEFAWSINRDELQEN